MKSPKFFVPLCVWSAIIMQSSSLFANGKSEFIIEALNLENARVEDAVYFLQTNLDEFRASNPNYPIKNIEFSNNLSRLRSPLAISNYNLIASNNLSHISFEDALKIISETSAVTCRKEGETVFISDKNDGGQLQIRLFAVPRDFFLKGRTPKESLENIGISFPSETCAIYAMGRGVLVCINYETELNNLSNFLTLSKKGRQVGAAIPAYESKQLMSGEFAVGNDVTNHAFFLDRGDGSSSLLSTENIMNQLDIPVQSFHYTKSKSKLIIRAPYHIIQFFDSYIKIINGRPTQMPGAPLEYLQAASRPEKMRPQEIKDESGGAVKEFLVESSGKIYKNPLRTRQTTSTVSFVHDEGAASIPISKLHPTMQAMLGFNASDSRPDIIEKVAYNKVESKEKQDAAAELLKKESPPKSNLALVTPEPTNKKILFNGFSISDILNTSVVAINRAPVYELQQIDGEIFNIIAQLKQTDSNTPNLSSKSLERVLYESPSVQNPRPGVLLGYVRSGFVLKHLNCREGEYAAVVFPKDIGGCSVGCVKISDFAQVGGVGYWSNAPSGVLQNFSSPEIEQIVETTKNTTLLSPFLPERNTYHQKILSNASSLIKNLWLINTASNKIQVVNSNITAIQGIAETPAGFFMGYFFENDSSMETSSITWEQLINKQKAKYKLKKEKSSIELRDDDIILTAFNKDRRSFQGLSFEDPNELIISPSQYARLLTKGTYALLGSLEIPKADGFELVKDSEANPSSTKSIGPQLEIQKQLESVEIKFNDFDSSSLSVTVSKTYKKREVERLGGSSGYGFSYKTTPWKDFKENYAHEYNLGVDGALTLTDGVKIYRIAEGFMRKPEMSVYSIGEN